MGVEIISKSECSCDQCKQMCKHSPCIGTPNDIAKLIAAGYIDNLSPTLVLDHITKEAVPILAISGISWQPEPGVHASKCTMQDEEGLCRLHAKGLKPTEGKLMICGKPHEFSFTIRHAVLAEWDSPFGKAITSAIK